MLPIGISNRYRPVTSLPPDVNAIAGPNARWSSKLKGSAMSLSHGPTLDDLLADPLIQTVMRADHVEPQALRALMSGAAGRIAAGRASQGAGRFARSDGDRRAASRGANRPLAARPPARFRGGHRDALCSTC
jgi:hypothetical protein